MAYKITFSKWRVEKVHVRSVFNLTFVTSLQVEVPIRLGGLQFANLQIVKGNLRKRRKTTQYEFNINSFGQE
jgi:hypothetical protein